MGYFFTVAVTSGTPARISVDPVQYGVQELLVPEAERMIVELRNAINAARRRNAPVRRLGDPI